MEARVWLCLGDALYIDRSILFVLFSREATYCRRLLSTSNMAGEFKELAFWFYLVLMNQDVQWLPLLDGAARVLSKTFY